METIGSTRNAKVRPQKIQLALNALGLRFLAYTPEGPGGTSCDARGQEGGRDWRRVSGRHVSESYRLVPQRQFGKEKDVRALFL